ncbi:MAG: PorV/PorQ family protein [Ignavibacteriae bacterium]|nr:PorV/PorQ family protein [Ignavibacteriota bacterium]
MSRRPVLKFILLISIIILMTNESISQQMNGYYSSSYLNRNTSSRVNAMAGAYTAVVNDPNSVFINPAGIGFLLNKPMFVTSVSAPGIGRIHSNLAYGQGIGEHFGIGFGINSFTSGQFQGRDIMGNPTSTMRDWQYSMNLSTAYSNEEYSFGGTLKYLGRDLQGSGTSARGFAFDLGTKFNVADLFSFGAAVQNIGATIKWNTPNKTVDELPVTVRSGIAVEFGLNDKSIEQRTSITGEVDTLYIPATKYLLVSFDAVFRETDIAPSFLLGAEIVPTELFAIRGGFNVYGEDNGTPKLFPVNIWGAGISLRPKLENAAFDLNIDYSVSNEYILGSGVTHHISLILDFK